MPSDVESSQEENGFVAIKGTAGPKDRPAMPEGMLKPPGANPIQNPQQPSAPSSDES